MGRIPPDEYCDHPNVAFCRRVLKNSAKHFGLQCRTCGQWVPLKKEQVPIYAPLEEYDDTIRSDFWQLRNAQATIKREQERQEKSREWWEKYDAYLESETWRSKRKRVLERDGYVCQACQARKAVQVHHLTYDRVFHEPLFDLVSVCGLCHDELTKLRRGMDGLA